MRKTLMLLVFMAGACLASTNITTNTTYGMEAEFFVIHWNGATNSSAVVTNEGDVVFYGYRGYGSGLRPFTDTNLVEGGWEWAALGFSTGGVYGALNWWGEYEVIETGYVINTNYTPTPPPPPPDPPPVP